MIIDFIKVLILSIVEGVTEFLPVSSTGHLILVNQFVKLEPEGFSNAFNIIIQLGAILSVVVIYFKRLNPWDREKTERYFPRNYDRLNGQSRFYFRLTHPDKKTIELWKRVIVGILPAMVLGLLFDDFIDEHLFNPMVVATMLLVWGLIIIFVEKRNKKDKGFRHDNIAMVSYKTVLAIGFFQTLAMIPGTSRSAATIMGAMILGLSRSAAAEFSFFLAIPTMLGATFLKVVKNFGGFTAYQWLLILLGMVLSFLVAYFVIKKFMAYIRNNDFIPFGIYRIILAIIVFVYFLFF
ncbi:MAG: undecaprenyl-diphosphate phosphatase [Anaerococcus sp.]|uniref:undecaprenyl-diphosphate phosphatase n=1 Tax=Anaerococcus sp. TaxID=1872515 RepID=UPI00261D8351|nr:undecaprenyl-diphosphate phosphatase [Anaerococcus sp.]MCI5972240.1 undecaprenyl-diphosphate phosphatase [Anaerococcus sp.]MDD6918318.1 undecaprenyl-diphosphate phosphatase [Peptoniphilaceae bacterium]MDY2927465.1 undecaprenyl-diphosphate phosphatase [Anaerococcus sp.]